MGIKFDSFEINGIDVSTFNGKINWSKIACNFAAIRVGYGNSIDNRFIENWNSAKVNRIPYWYMDYYSNWYNTMSSAYGLTDYEWGKRQAENCWNAIKDDFSGIVFLDIESGASSYSKPLTDPVAKVHGQQIARAFLERIDELSGKTNGIYTSIGWLSWFWSWFRDRPLWVAWYNELVDKEDVLYSCLKNGWDGKVLIWQYASDGDVDDNGTGDGKVFFGASEKFMDLNGWIASDAEYALMFGVPDDEAEVIPQPEYKTYEVNVGALSYLNVRETPNGTIRGRLLKGAKVNVSEISNGWAKLHGQDLYISANFIK